jgi:hypothetical protein
MKNYLTTIIKTISLSIMLAMGVATFAVPASPAFAQSAKSQVCDAIGGAAGNRGCDVPGTSSPASVVKTAINILSLVVGVAAVIMIIIGGFKYVTSAGDSNSIASAKNTVIYAIVGLIIASLAQVIVRFVLNRI